MGKYKYRTRDTLAIIACLCLLAIIMVLLPDFWAWWIKAAIGLVFAFVTFIGYVLVLRPSDEVIGIEEKLYLIVDYANQINGFAQQLQPEAVMLQPLLKQLASDIANTALRIFSREFQYMSVEIDRLERLGYNITQLCLQVVTTGIVIEDLRHVVLLLHQNQLPEAIATVKAINIQIDHNQAKMIIAAEKDLELIHDLYKQNTSTLEAISQLQAILQQE
jgi:hypothetical protein